MGHDRNQTEAFDAAVREHGALVWRVATSYEARHALAEELVQEVFAALWRALPSFRGEAGLRTFIARIAHNVCVSHVRRERRSTEVALDEDLPTEARVSEEEAHRSIERERLLRAVRALPIGLRQVVTLHLEGFAHREVAEALGIGEGNVAVRLTRARAKLRMLMGADR